jgi:hypothetical protein
MCSSTRRPWKRPHGQRVSFDIQPDAARCKGGQSEVSLRRTFHTDAWPAKACATHTSTGSVPMRERTGRGYFCSATPALAS